MSKAHEIPERQGFSRTRRLMITLPIFIILLGVLVMASNYTRLPADNTPTGQTFATLSPNTEVTFDTREQLPKQGAYKVHEWHQACLVYTADRPLYRRGGRVVADATTRMRHVRQPTRIVKDRRSRWRHTQPRA